MQNGVLMGLDIGGTKCAVIVGQRCDDGVRIHSRYAISTDLQLSPDQMLDRLEDLARQMLTETQIRADQISSIGVSCGGPLESASGVILGPPNLPGWDHVPIVQRFERAFGVPVRLQNDADACALAEWRWGAGQGSQNMIFLTFGTGLGAGLILNGRLYSGGSGLAGEVGHIRLAEDGPMGYGKHGSFEGFCSGGGIAYLARETVQKHWNQGKTVAFCPDESSLALITAQTVAGAARQGDPIALEIYGIVAQHLGKGLALLVDILDPELIVIGGIFTRTQDLLWPLAHQKLQDEALGFNTRNCRIVPSALGEQIGDYACLAVAL